MKKIYFLLLTLFISVASIGQTTVFINEMHYDNSGTDSDEGIEIAGPAGTDLSTYTITPYNGGGGTSYSATALTGTIPNESGTGYGAVFFPISGLQNGSPDGIALDNGGTLIQFLSYEGSFTATNGVANTVTSTDIGVSETGGTTVGQSLQLSGSGSTYEDFTWSAPASHSRGGINISQVFGAAAPTINTNPATVSGLSYFEGNGPSNESSFSASALNLIADVTVSAPTNFEISLTSGTGFTDTIILEAPGGTVNATTIYVRMIAGLTSNTYAGDIELTSPSAADNIVAVDGVVSPADPFITLSGFTSNMEYNSGNGPSTEESFDVEGMFLTADITVTAPADFEVSLTQGTGFAASVMLPQIEGTVASSPIYIRLAAGLAEGPYSGDVIASSTGATNQLFPVTGTVFALAVCSNAGDIVITEVMRNPAAVSDTNGEYFEVYNASGAMIDMNGWIIKDDASAGETHTISSSVQIASGAYAVFALSSATATNGGLTVDYEYSGISLGNSGTDGLIIECATTVIDQVIWDGTFPPASSGVSMELSSTLPGARNNTDNDDGANWALATSPYGDGDLGTPGAANDFTLSNNNFDANGFSIYPNPTTTGFVNIKANVSGDISISVFNVLGKQIINQKLNNERLDVSSLKTGVYIMKITQDSNTATKKLIIK